MSKRHGVDSKPNRELTKNVLRSRTCETCGRHSSRFYSQSQHCELSTKMPEHGVCSQWKMDQHTKFRKQWDHKIKVAKKRKEKREAKKEVATAS